MQHTIWKFPLEWAGRQSISIPKGCRLLTVQIQNNTPCLWAVVNPEAPKKMVDIAIVGTGNRCECPDWDYLGTAQVQDEVYHVFYNRTN